MLLSQPTACVESCDDDHLTNEIRPDGTYYEYKYDNNGNTSTLTYDEAGRLSTVTDGAGVATTLSYDNDGNLSLIENALGSKTQLKYNEYRKIAEATDNNGCY